MPYTYILEKKWDEFALPSQFTISNPIETLEEAKTLQERALTVFKCNQGQVVEIYMPITEFQAKYNGRGTYVSESVLNEFLKENKAYNEKNVRDVATFFGKSTPTIEEKPQMHIEEKSGPKV